MKAIRSPIFLEEGQQIARFFMCLNTCVKQPSSLPSEPLVVAKEMDKRHLHFPFAATNMNVNLKTGGSSCYTLVLRYLKNIAFCPIPKNANALVIYQALLHGAQIHDP